MYIILLYIFHQHIQLETWTWVSLKLVVSPNWQAQLRFILQVGQGFSVTWLGEITSLNHFLCGYFFDQNLRKSWNNWFFLGVLIGLQELFNIETNWFLVVGWHSYTAVAGIICKPLNPAALRSKWKFLSLFWRGKQLPPPFWSNQVSDMHHLSDTPF